MKIKTNELLGFGNKADIKNDTMVGSKSSKPRKKRRKKKQWLW